MTTNLTQSCQKAYYTSLEKFNFPISGEAIIRPSLSSSPQHPLCYLILSWWPCSIFHRQNRFLWDGNYLIFPSISPLLYPPQNQDTLAISLPSYYGKKALGPVWDHYLHRALNRFISSPIIIFFLFTESSCWCTNKPPYNPPLNKPCLGLTSCSNLYLVQSSPSQKVCWKESSILTFSSSVLPSTYSNQALLSTTPQMTNYQGDR